MKLTKDNIITFRVIDQHNDIITVELGDHLRVDLTMARMLVADRLSFTNNKGHYLVIDVSRVRSITTEAKKYLQKPESGLKNILGAALIASNPVSALIANIFIKTPKNFQAKFFSNKADAIEWIYEYRLKKNSNP